MAGQIIFFKKNRADFSYGYVTATASEGNDFASFVLNRSNLSAWLTTGSEDANNTTLEINLAETRSITDILLIKHNFKSYKVEWHNGSTYQDFSPAINETGYTEENSFHEFDSIITDKIRVTIYGTQTPNEDKILYQFIATEKIGQLESWPIVKKPELSRNRKMNQMLSGKQSIVENVGSFSVTLQFSSLSSENDLELLETLYNASEGFLVWLCGGNEEQFRTVRLGYRLEDIYLMKCADEYQPEYNRGLYKAGINLDMKLEEVIS